MKFKVLKGTVLFDKLLAIVIQIHECNQQAHDLALEQGAIGVATTGNNRAGGIDAFRFKYDTEPDVLLWKQVDKYHYADLYSPRANKKNNNLFSQIQALPRIGYKEYNAVIGYEQQWIGLSLHQSYGLFQDDDFFLIELSDEVNYTPVADMTEILSSEYKTLKEKSLADKEESLLCPA
jgi:hypothetical protein